MLAKSYTLEGFEELMEDWHDKSSDSVYLHILPGILKSDIGGVLEHELPNKQDICYGLMEVNFAFKVLKEMVSYSDCHEVKAIKIYKHLINDIIGLLENNTEDDVWDSIYLWVDETLNDQHIDREYALRKKKCFDDLISILKQCFKISEALHKKEREATNGK